MGTLLGFTPAKIDMIASFLNYSRWCRLSSQLRRLWYSKGKTTQKQRHCGMGEKETQKHSQRGPVSFLVWQKSTGQKQTLILHGEAFTIISTLRGENSLATATRSREYLFWDRTRSSGIQRSHCTARYSDIVFGGFELHVVGMQYIADADIFQICVHVFTPQLKMLPV